MNAPLLSVIIPMYKVENYISECLDSLLTQIDYDFEIEIITINDGSPDRSGEIAKEYSDKDPRVKLINQKNGGLSLARNVGLEAAKGKYVWFVDSDDWVSNNSLQLINNVLNKENPEALHIVGADVINDKPEILFSLKKLEGKHLRGIDIIGTADFHGVVQYTIYKKDFLVRNNLRFMPGIYHEDTEFSPRAYYYLKDIICLDSVLYLKRVNENSITRTVNPKKNYDLIKIASSHNEFADKLSDIKHRKLFKRLSSNDLKMAMTNETVLMDKKTRKEFNRHLYANRYLLKSFFDSDRKISKIEGILLRIFSHNMLFVNNKIFQNSFLRKIAK